MPLPSCITKAVLVAVLFLSIVVPSVEAQVEEEGSTKTVVVIGTGKIYKGDSARARETAVSRSLVAAVDMVILEILPVESIVRSFETINQTLYNHTDEFVQGYRVLTEFPSQKHYRVMVEVTISLDILKEKLSAAGIVVGHKALPSILLLIAEQHFVDGLLSYWWGKDSVFFEAISEVSLAEILNSKGYSIVDHNDITLIEGIDGLYDKPELTNQEAAAFTGYLHADVVISGKSTARIVPNVMGTNIRSFKGIVSARAIRTDTGKEIAATEQSAVKASSDEIAGIREALATAGVQAANELASQIADAWQKDVQEPSMVEITLERTGNLANFVKFRTMLSQMPGVSEMQVKEMKSDQAIIVVFFQGSAKKLADALILKTFETISINIYEVSENHLKIELVPG